MRRGSAIGVGLAALLVAAATAWSASAPRGPDPAVKEWPAWPYLTQCEGLPFYPVSVFSGNTEAERGSRPSEVALREALQRGEISYARSPENWRLLAEDESQAEFVHGRLSGQLQWVRFEEQDGAWDYTGYGGCRPTSIVGRGPVVAWRLVEPEAGSNVGVREIRVDLAGGPCNDGRPQNPLARKVFRKWGRKLLMTVWLKPPSPGVHSCKGAKEPPLKVTLPRKIELSRLYDGSTYPPTPAIERD